MLIDELMVANLAYSAGVDISPILPRLRKAQKFILGAEFAAVAEALSEDYSGLVKIFDRCRLPYPEVWIEVAQADRPRFVSAGVQLPEVQRAPKKIGFLLSATRDDLSAWMTHLFWNFENGMCGAATCAMECDMARPINNFTSIGLDEEIEQARKQDESKHIHVRKFGAHPGWINASESIKLIMSNHTAFKLSDFNLYVPKGMTKEQIDEYGKIVREMARSDWAGEGPYMLAVIGLLNARNAVETETVDYERLNKARIKSGKLPLFEHKVLKIARRQVERVYPGDDKRPRDHAPMRGHFVRGHFKARKSGIFFWHPFARGHFSRGQVTKDYKL